MSIILDALRRADSDRGERGRGSAVRVPGTRARRGRNWWPAAAVLVLGNVLLILWLLAPADPEPVVLEPAVVAPGPVQPTAARPTPGRQVPSDDPAEVTARAAAPAPRSEPRPGPTRTTQPVVRDPGRDVPLLNELTLELRQRIPAYSLDVHVYADAPEQRFVMLSMERLGQGATSRDGITVVSILPDGVILSWSGTEFLQPR